MVRKVLQYLDENQPIKAIDLKDAVFMMAKAWDNTKKTKEHRSEERGLWGRVVQEYPLLADVPFTHFASLDSDIITDCQPTEEDATRQALEAVQSKQTTASGGDESDSDGNSISVIEPTPLTPLEANEAVKALRNYVMTFDESSAREREFLRSLSSMEDAFIRVQEKEQRQAKLGEYFQ
ncbi:hypothetical protein QZH41_011689 [Actinostola sp. cb2023]|nr:hypothetical protein QZH41_011689 [Actinostola sp. cb2023]